MRGYQLPANLEAVVFDIDRTLYDHDEYADEQVESQYRRAATAWGTSLEEARSRVKEWRDQYARDNDGRHQSLGNSLAGLGIPIETSVTWRLETIDPAAYLTRDDRLVAALKELAAGHVLMALTNNPTAVGQATLDVLGVGGMIGDVIGLDTTGYSKPSPEPFREAIRRLGFDAGEILSVGDRYDVDVEPALVVGMGAVLVEGVHDVYALPRFLKDAGLLD